MMILYFYIMLFMLRVATIQLVSTDNIGDNLEQAARLIHSAVVDKAEFILLPENFSFMGQHEEDKLVHAEEYGTGPIQTFLNKQAKQHGIWLMGGTLPLKSIKQGKIRAACLLFDPEGECVCRYDKIHLFDVSVESGGNKHYRESSTIDAGDEIVVAKTAMGNIGMSVCYDLRFPELYRNFINQDVNIITVPSAFTATTGQAHWETLLRCRAIENLCYVIAANQGGTHIDERRTWGHSMIVDPWGNILGCVEQGPGMTCADLDFAQQKILRENFPCLEHRKLNYIMS